MGILGVPPRLTSTRCARTCVIWPRRQRSMAARCGWRAVRSSASIARRAKAGAAWTAWPTPRTGSPSARQRATAARNPPPMQAEGEHEMNQDSNSRRNFLKGVARVTAIIPIHVQQAAPLVATLGTALAASAASAPGAGSAPLPPDGYQFFSIEESAFVEAMVTTMCPADELTPDGVQCGLATFMDRHLAGGFGSGERLYMEGPWQAGKPGQGYQLPFDPAGFFRAGLAAAQTSGVARQCRTCEHVPPAQRAST